MLSTIGILFLLITIQTVKTDVSHTLARYNNQQPDIVYANTGSDFTDCHPANAYVNAYNPPIYNRPYGRYYDDGSPVYPVYQPPYYPVNVGPPAFAHPLQPPVYVGHPGPVQPPVYVGHPGPAEQPVYADHPVPVEPPVYVDHPVPVEPPVDVGHPIEPRVNVHHPEPTEPTVRHTDTPVHVTTEPPAPYPPSNSYLPPENDHKKIPVEGSDYHSQEHSDDISNSRVESLAQKARPRPIYNERRHPIKFRQYHTETTRNQYKNAANVEQTTTTTEGPTCVTTQKQYPPGAEIDRPSVNQTRTYEIRRPGIRKEFYDIEKRVIIRPVGSAVVELENQQATSSSTPATIASTTVKNSDNSYEQSTPKRPTQHNHRKLSEDRGPTRFQINTNYAHIEFNNNHHVNNGSQAVVQPPSFFYQAPDYSEKPYPDTVNQTSTTTPTSYVYYETSTQLSTTPIPSDSQQNYTSTNNFVDIVYANTNATSASTSPTTQAYASYFGPTESGNIDQLEHEYQQRGDSKAPNVHRIQHVDKFYHEDPKTSYVIPKHVEINSNGVPLKINVSPAVASDNVAAASVDNNTKRNTNKTEAAIIVYPAPRSETEQNIHESHQRLIHLFSIKNDNSVPPQYENNGNEKILYVTPAPEYERVAASDAKTSVHRVVVSKPIETVHRIQITESIKEHPVHGPTKVNSDGGSVEYVTPVPQMMARLRAGNPVPKTLL